MTCDYEACTSPSTYTCTICDQHMCLAHVWYYGQTDRKICYACLMRYSPVEENHDA